MEYGLAYIRRLRRYDHAPFYPSHIYHTMTDVVQKRKSKSDRAQACAKMTRQHQQTLTDIYQDTIARQHDLKHQLQAIEQLVAQGNSEAAKKYLAEYENKIEGSEVYVTGSVAVDALLTAKLLACKQNHIELSWNSIR